jgi:hypothetical protein
MSNKLGEREKRDEMLFKLTTLQILNLSIRVSTKLWER